MTAIKDKINEIIDRRIGRNGFEGHGHLDAIQQKNTLFEKLLKQLLDFETLRNNILAQIKEKKGEYYSMSLEDPFFLQNIEQTDCSSLITQVQICLNECKRLEQRFNRETINISVVGRARQGKSRLLQSISGLPNEVIPASNGSDCTGAKSVITNAPGKTHAHIVFYNEVEMVEQIQKYIDASGLTLHLGTLKEVEKINDYPQSADIFLL